MQRTEIFHFTTSATPKTAFTTVADMPNYKKWLQKSTAFTDTTSVSPHPVQLGTTYLDYGSQGERPGKVFRFTPNSDIGFQHQMHINRIGMHAVVEVTINYSFIPVQSNTRVNRELIMTINAKGISKLLIPLIVIAFRHENVRLMKLLKKYLDTATV